VISYILRRLGLIIPTLIGIMIINFFIIQSAPGGPVEKTIARLKGVDVAVTERITKGGGGEVSQTKTCLLYTSPSPRDQRGSRMPSSA